MFQRPLNGRWTSAARWTVLVAAVLCIYLPDAGHGFVQDDFAWILQARGDALDSVWRAFTTSLGFYRPIVTLSFTVNDWLFGMAPFWYGATNLLLTLACVAAIDRLGRQVGLAPGHAMLAAAVWVFSFHGINMGVLWISARTSLLLTLFAVLAARAFDARRSLAAAAWTMFALLSKEEAILLPFVFAAWSFVDSSRSAPRIVALRRAMLDTLPLFVVLAAYLLSRGQSGAFTPSTAPWFYRFTGETVHLIRNLVEYLHRSAITGCAVVVAVAATARALPRPDGIRSAIVLKGVIWWAGGFALTMALPVRSSLYAVLPSVGIGLIAAALAASLVPRLAVERRRALVAVGLVLPFLLLPVYWSRNVRWVELADLSAATLAHVQAELPNLPDHAIVELIDDSESRASFANAFGSLTPAASRLFLERGIELRIDPPIDASRPRYQLKLTDVRPLGTEGRDFPALSEVDGSLGLLGQD